MSGYKSTRVTFSCAMSLAFRAKKKKDFFLIFFLDLFSTRDHFSEVEVTCVDLERFTTGVWSDYHRSLE